MPGGQFSLIFNLSPDISLKIADNCFAFIQLALQPIKLTIFLSKEPVMLRKDVSHLFWVTIFVMVELPFYLIDLFFEVLILRHQLYLSIFGSF